jgi:hypothetical protein
VFSAGSGVERAYFPEKSGQVPDRAVLTFVVLAPELSLEDETKTMRFIEQATREHGSSSRTFKNALVWCVPDSGAALADEARKILAWSDIRDNDLDRLDDAQKRQLNENLRKAERDLCECVWRTYKNLVLLGTDNSLHAKDLGLVHSSAAKDLLTLMLDRLKHDGDVEEAVSPNRLIKHWPAMTAWSTKGVRDAFFASPLLPRLLNPDSVRDTIARGVQNGLLAYVGKGKGDRYEPFHFKESLATEDVEVSDEMFVITADEAKKNIEPPRLTTLAVSPANATVEPGKKQTYSVRGLDQHGRDIDAGTVTWSATGGTIGADAVFQAGPDEGNFLVTATAGGAKATAAVTIRKPGEKRADDEEEEEILQKKKEPTSLSWEGQVPAQKWMNFYTKVLSKFAASKGLKLTVRFELTGDGPISPQKIEETRVALRELGLDDTINLKHAAD